MNSTKLSKPVRRLYTCECGNGDQRLWWVLKYTRKVNPQTRIYTNEPNFYQLQADSRIRSPGIKHCPNCGIKLPEPIETLPEKK